MELRVKCLVKNLNLHELKRSLSQNQVYDFSSEEYTKSSSLRKAIQDNWVVVLKKSQSAPPKLQKKIEKVALETKSVPQKSSKKSKNKQ